MARLNMAIVLGVLLGLTTLPTSAQAPPGNPFQTLQAEITALQQTVNAQAAQIATLQKTVNTLQPLAAALSYNPVSKTITLTGVNIQIVNGMGTTATTNGVGNLIIGYNEADADSPSVFSGSHNLVIGVGNGYSQYGGMVVGHDNLTSAPFAVVSGGWFNTAFGKNSSVSGGSFNLAGGDFSSVSGGDSNRAEGGHSSVSGGEQNFAVGDASSVSGGTLNNANGTQSSVSGGQGNFAGGGSSVSGGVENRASGIYSSVSGGTENIASGAESSVSGGVGNIASGGQSSVSGGTVIENNVDGWAAGTSGTYHDP
jgi:hypothetical protein